MVLGNRGMSGPKSVRVLLVEDHPVVRLGLHQLMEREGHEVCGEAATFAEAEAALRAGAPELVVIDLCLGPESGMELLQNLALKHPTLVLLVYSGLEDAIHIERALAAGARGYVTKGESFAVLGAAIRECLAGECYLSPKVRRSLLQSPYVRELLASLSPQELDVYRLLGQGVATREIAARMDLSPRTVESYLARIQIKLGLTGMKELKKQATEKPV